MHQMHQNIINFAHIIWVYRQKWQLERLNHNITNHYGKNIKRCALFTNFVIIVEKCFSVESVCCWV